MFGLQITNTNCCLHSAGNNPSSKFILRLRPRHWNQSLHSQPGLLSKKHKAESASKSRIYSSPTLAKMVTTFFFIHTCMFMHSNTTFFFIHTYIHTYILTPCRFPSASIAKLLQYHDMEIQNKGQPLTKDAATDTPTHIVETYVCVCVVCVCVCMYVYVCMYVCVFIIDSNITLLT